MLKLRLVRGSAVPPAVPVADGVTFGRAPESSVVLRDPLASRVHAKIAVRDGVPWVVDLGSANGTEVNGALVQQARIEEGSTLSFGETQFRAVDDVGTDPVALPSVERRRRPLMHTIVRVSAEIDAQPLPLSAPQPAVEAVARDVASSDDVLVRFHRFARGAATVVAADASYVLVRVSPGGPLVVAGSHASGAASEPPALPRGVLAQIGRSGRALLLELAPRETPGAAGRAPDRALVMCAPIGPVGAEDAVLYAERADAGKPFTEQDLEAFAALASQAGPSFAGEVEWFRWRAQNEAAPAPTSAPVLVGESPAFLAMLDVADHVAATRVPVLLRGEPGTGRRTVARLLHARGDGSARYAEIACASLPRGDEAAALLGEARGQRRRPGAADDVGSGTLCLVEIADLPIAAQRALAEALRTGRVSPGTPGDSRLFRCRVVATTAMNLQQLASAGTFDADLAAALSGVTIGVPSLDVRRDDVPRLAAHFAALHGRRIRGRACTLSEDALDVLRAASFPGQVAGLSNRIERAVLGATDTVLGAADVGDAAAAGDASGDLRLEAAERVAVERALAASGGKRGRAARLLGVSEPTLRRRLREFGID